MTACSQDTTKLSSRHEFLLGSTMVAVNKTGYGNTRTFQLLQLHHDETTADSAARQLSQELGIDYIQVLNDGKRLVDFAVSNNRFRFDPNRMFSREGIISSLQLHSRQTDKAFDIVYVFQQNILSLLDTAKTIIAVHNNSDEEFTLADYINNKTGLVHRNPVLDPDDFFITTDSSLFSRLKEKDFNVVWEWSDRLKDDGSLSIYCSRLGICYVNVEAEHGHYKEQTTMLQALIEILK